MSDHVEGCWIAYFLDFSGFAVYADEVSALRALLPNSGHYDDIVYVKWGESPREVIENRWVERQKAREVKP